MASVPVSTTTSPRRPVPVQATLDELGTPLREVTFVVVDLETTGGPPTPGACPAHPGGGGGAGAGGAVLRRGPGAPGGAAGGGGDHGDRRGEGAGGGGAR